MSQFHDSSKLLFTGNLNDIKNKMKENPYDPKLWSELGMATAEEEGSEQAIDVFSRGLTLFPFDAELIFCRGRRYIGLRKYNLAIADATMAIRLEPFSFCHWYYRAVPRYLNGDYEEAISDFEACLKLIDIDESYPVFVWLFRCYVESGQMEKAKQLLEQVDTSIPTNRMDYGYRREFQLFKGDIKPEELIDIKDIEENSLVKQPGIDYEKRLRLETESMTFGLFTYYDYHGNTEKANEVLREVIQFQPSAAFAYLSALGHAERRGLI